MKSYSKQSGFSRLIIIIAVVVIAIAGYVLFVGMPDSGDDASALLSSTGESQETDAVRDELFALLDTLKMLQLDGSLFADERFTSLIDWSVPIVQQPVGRPNPFLPVGRDD